MEQTTENESLSSERKDPEVEGKTLAPTTTAREVLN